MPPSFAFEGEVVADRPVSRPTLKFASGELVFGYRLIRPLGKGSFGEVWLATNDKGFEWALKIVSLAGSGGKKEFRALQLIKDRKIKSTHLLKLIDYGLLDRDGTSLVVAPSVETAPKIVPVPPPMPLRGTLFPTEPIHPAARTSIEQLAARDTQQTQELTHDDLPDLHSRAAWLVIVMELGDRTLHELQLEETRRERSQRASRATRVANRSGTVLRSGNPGSKKPSAQTSFQDSDDEEPLAPLPVARILTYIDQAARGLDYLHRHEILHRDVKPQNIMLIDADAKLCDYGLASEFRNTTATTEGCSPAYAAPEAINNRPVPSSDQYSLAVTYVELVTGRWPFSGTTQTAIYREKDEGRHNLTFIRNRSTRRVLARALAKHPEDRYPTCTEFARELAAAENAPQGSTLRPLLKWLTAACCLSAVAGASFMYRDQIRDWFKRPLAPPVAEIVIDPLAAVRLPAANLDKLAATPVSFASAEPTGFQRAAEQPPIFVEHHRLLRAAGQVQQPRFDKVAYVTSGRFPTRVPQPLVARPISPVPPLPKYVYRNADEELAALWSSKINAPDDFLPRFAELIGKSQRSAQWWSDLARRADDQPNWLTACERNLLVWLTDSTVENQTLRGLPGFKEFASQIKDQGVDRMLRFEFKPPVDMAKLRKSLAFVLNQDRPIALWLLTDWELAGKAVDEAWLTERLQQLAATRSAVQGGKPADVHFQHYVSALLQSRRTASDAAAAALGELNKLLADDQLPAWMGPERRLALARCIGKVTVTNIRLSANDLPRLASRPPVAANDLLQLQLRAEDHGLASAETTALRSLCMALMNESPDWRKVQEDARTALADTDTKRHFAQHDRLLLLEYVAAVAQLRTALTAADNIDLAVEQTASILQSRTPSGPRYFDQAQDQQPIDEGLLKNLVLPVLKHPAAERIAASHPQAVNLAALYGAQGRILQRKPGATPADLQQAHAAFSRARELDSRSPRSAGYLLGYCTTFAPRPVLSLVNLPRDRQLISLVKQLPNEWTAGKSIPANVALLKAHVFRMQGEFADAAQSYSAARDARLDSDPFHIQEAALLNLCYVQLEQAKLAPWRESDFQPDSLDSPPLNSKSYFLVEALANARAAEKLPASLQREQVFLAQGVALERQAVAFGLASKYGEAAAAYQQAIGEAQSAQRPAAACRLSLARCYVTGFSDPVLASTRDIIKADRLQQAIVACNAVLEEKVAVELDEAKRTCDLAAYYWRGRAREELAKLPEQPAGSLRAEAARDFRAAIRLGKSTTAPEVGAAFLALLRASKPASGTHDSGSLLTAKALLTECLQMLQEEPRNFTPVVIQEIAEENRLPATSSVPSPAIVPFIQWFSASWPIPEPWTVNDDWRVAGARLASLASTSNANDAFRKAANDLAFSIQDPARRNLAQSYLQHKQLSLQVKAFIGQQNKPASNVAGGAALPAAAPAGGGGTGQLDSVFQRYFDSVQQAVDPITRTNLARLNRFPTEKLTAEFQKLPPLQQRLIREHLTRDVTLEDRLRVWELVESAQAGNGNGSGGASSRLDQIAHDLLKPMHLLAAGDASDPAVVARLKRTAAGLRSAEEKLGIRSKDEAKEKSKAATAPPKKA